MAAKQRLTLASMWAFEDIGVCWQDTLRRTGSALTRLSLQVQEIQNEFRFVMDLSCLAGYTDSMVYQKSQSSVELSLGVFEAR